MSRTEGPSGDAPGSAVIKQDWYQTETTVVVVLLAKKVDASACRVSFEERSVTAAFPSGDSAYERTLRLRHGVVPSKCGYKVYPTKVELKLVKAEGLHWAELEAKREETATPTKPQARDWDRVVAQLEDEQPEGEAALNALFQKIYNEGSDEVKKAMNKSFLESGGTELNTNWEAVKRDRVSVKPPDGMEWKSWDN